MNVAEYQETTVCAERQVLSSLFIPGLSPLIQLKRQTDSKVMAANKPKKRSQKDPVEDQLRFEAALYGDWYSQSIHTSYVQEQFEKHRSADSLPRMDRELNTLSGGQ